MKTILLVVVVTTASVGLAAPTPFADPPKSAPPAEIPPPTQLAVANSQPRPVIEYDYTPRLNRPSPPPQAVPDKQKIVEQFRAMYAKQNKPRLLLYINRDVYQSEPKEKEKNLKAEDKDQTVRQQIMTREIEDAFGLPFQDGGAVFVDRHFASL